MRFQPDSWVDAVMRPIDLAAASGGVYAEIMAPDFRFAFVLALLALMAGLAVARRRGAAAAGDAGRGASRRTTFVLLGVLAAGFVVWLATTGNGRYFMAGLVLVGPVCVGLACLLPLTRAARLGIVLAMVGLQALAVQQAAPWSAWSYAPWRQAPYFHVEIPEDLRTQPATYVTLSAISYSLLAPMFDADSRWMSLNTAPTPRSGSADAARAQALLAGTKADRLLLLVPAVAGMMTDERLPTGRMAVGLDQQLAPHLLRLAQPTACRFLPSRGLASMGLGEKTAKEQAQSGFWVCSLQRVAPAAHPAPAGSRHDAAFRVLEAQCPRFFPSGGDGDDVALANGSVRSYHRGDLKAYVYDGGEVYYKYYRAMNPVLVGKSEDLLAGRLRVDCDRVRGRTAQP